MRRCTLHASFAALALVACGTLGTEGSGGTNLPTSGVGPFRKLGGDEVLGVPPFVLDAQQARYREPSAMGLDDDPASARVALYAVGAVGDASAPHDAIVRTRADDGRSFFGDEAPLGTSEGPAIVLTAGAPWEGADLASPSALRVGERVYLYYAGNGGVGLAVSDDGFAFTKKSAPVLAPDPTVAWETTPPREPSVAIFPDGTWHMLYAAGDAIGEATSADGEAWTRVDGDPSTPAIDPVLAPAPSVDPATLPPGAKPPFDTARVGDPCLAPQVTPAGRLQVRVLYTGFVADGSSTIGFAARFGADGPLERQASAVYSVSKHERGPAFFEWGGGSLLYVQQDFGSGTASSPIYPAIAAAYAPADHTLPTPTAAADGP